MEKLTISRELHLKSETLWFKNISSLLRYLL